MTTSTDPAATTQGLPVLARGRHARPAEGACLLEYTSVLAGRPFSDRPRCTAPVLATLGRLVNDAVSDERRQELARLAPDLTVRPHVTAGATASLVAAVLTDVASALGASSDRRDRRTARWLERNAAWESRRAASQQQSTWWVRATAIAHRSGAARLRLEYGVRATTTLPPDDRDRLLLHVLETAVASVPAGGAAPGTPPWARSVGVRDQVRPTRQPA